MKTKTIYKNARERVICIEDHNEKSFVLLDHNGKFIRELPNDFKPVDYIKREKMLSAVAAGMISGFAQSFMF